MKALTLWPEWAHAVAHLGKRIENRSWQPPVSLVGQRIAIHAGAHLGGRKGRVAADEAKARLLDATHLGLGAASVMTRSGPLGEPGRDALTPSFVDKRSRFVRVATSAIVATATLGEPYDGMTHPTPPWGIPDKWWWPLVDVRTLAEPVACKGAMGLWQVPAVVEQRMQVARWHKGSTR